jgi:hypothetical protein
MPCLAYRDRWTTTALMGKGNHHAAIAGVIAQTEDTARWSLGAATPGGPSEHQDPPR